MENETQETLETQEPGNTAPDPEDLSIIKAELEKGR